MLPPITKKTNQQELVTLVFSAALEFFHECGISAADVQKAFSTAQKEKGQRKFPADPIVMITAECLRQWHTSPEYTDEFGAPLALPKTGKSSLTNLITECGFNDPDSIIAAAVQAGFVTRKGTKFLPKDREALIPFEGTMPLWFTCQGVHRSFENMTRNVRNQGSSTPMLFHRVAHQLTLSKKHTPLFRRFVSDQGAEFIGMMDDWMDQHKAKVRGEPTIPVSVHAFAWIDNDDAGSSPRMASPKKVPKVVKAKRSNA